MKVELRPLSEIKPYPNNPRINDDAVDAVVASLREFGFRQPIVVDADCVIICGHTRYKAAQKLGLEKVPVHVAKDLSPEQIKAYRIADNQTASLAEWNYDLLPIEVGELQSANYDLGLLGFDQDELAKLLGGELQEGLTDPDDVPAPPDEAITQPGDLWVLGNHRLLCGDSSKPEDVDRLLDGAVIHLVNTDPPYNVRVEPRSNNAIAAGLSSFSNDAAAKKLRSRQGNAAFDIARGKTKVPGKMHHQGLDLARHPEKSKPTAKKLRAKDRPLANDFVTDGEFDRLLDAWFGNLARVLLPGRSFYVWGGYANLGNYPPFLKKHGLYFSQGIVWDKQHPVLTRKDFMGAHEWCQPPDTQVLTPSGSASLGSLTDADRVVSFDARDAAIAGVREGVGIQTTSRPYDGDLYGVVVGNRTTWTTLEHLWTVRLRPGYGSPRPRTMHACSLLPGIMEVPVPVGSQKIRWEPIRAVDVQPYQGPVYSMAVDRYQHYVADGLVTHNCFYGWKLGAAHEFFGPNNVPDLWAIKKVNPQAMVHLTEKPAELAARAMQYSSRPGENVLDLFGGSGSTLIAAEQTGRKAFLMELDPLYCDVIVQRFEKFTGKKAELATA